MPMRITQSMISNQLLRNVNSNLGKLDGLQNQLSSGRRINKPSDDPVGITYGLRYRSELSSNEQHKKNVDTAVSWLDYTESTLGQATDVMQRVRELAVKGANGTNPKDAMESIKLEVIQLREQLRDIANSKLNDKYIFNGQLTDQAPYPDAAAAASKGTDTFQTRYEVGAGVELPVNITGNEVFGLTTDTDNTFLVMDQLITALGNNNQAVVSDLLGSVNSRLGKFISARSEIGARSTRVELVQDRLQELNTNLTGLQAKVEDADMTMLIMELKTNESVYQASLSIGSQIIRPSLLDFLR